MNRKKTILFWSLLAISSLVVGLLLPVKILLPNRYKNIQIKNYSQEELCERLLNGEDPYYGIPKGYAMRQYFHCVLSLHNSGPCYLRYRQEIIFCLIQRNETMSEDEIKLHLTGGIMEEKCQNIELSCAPGQESDLGDPKDKEFEVFFKNYCEAKLKKECSDLNYSF